MKAQWLKYAASYDALQLRERWLVALAVLGGIVLIGYSLFVEPEIKRATQAERNVAEQRAQLASLQAQSAALQASKNDPDQAARAELARLRQQLDALAGRMQTMESSLVPPQRMAALLEDMIGRHSGLRLLALKTLPAAPLLEQTSEPAGAAKADGKLPNSAADSAANSAPGTAANPAAGLFKHGVEITLEGSYQDLAAYLERLEQSKMKLLWSKVSLSADKHPKLVLTLTVFTLSLDRTWLIV